MMPKHEVITNPDHPRHDPLLDPTPASERPAVKDAIANQRPDWAATDPRYGTSLWEQASHDAKGEGKPSNPKDLVGMTKSPLSIVPSTLVICAANALLEGALKYGRYNWRMCGVRASIYIDALGRHIAKWWNGQDLDKKTKVHHLDNAIACLTIIRDAMIYDMLDDDRPPCPNPDAIANLIDEQGEIIAHLKSEFKTHQPYQFTIKDTPRG